MLTLSNRRLATFGEEIVFERWDLGELCRPGKLGTVEIPSNRDLLDSNKKSEKRLELHPAGFEPATFGFVGGWSNRL